MEIIPDPLAAAIFTVPFLVTLLFLRSVLFAPFLEFLEDRDEVAGRARTEATDYQASTDAKFQDLEDRLKSARADIAEFRKQARAEAQEEENKVLAAARQTAETRVDEAVQQIHTDRDKAATTLRGTARILSGEIATQVLGR